MSEKILDEILAKANLLTPEEQLQVIAFLSEKTGKPLPRGNRTPRKWSTLVGMLSYPACDEDAQNFVTTIRKDSDLCRKF